MNRRGFTLLELIVVLVVLAVLVSIALPTYVNFAERARAAEAIHTISAIRMVQEAYKISTGHYGSSEDLNIGTNYDTPSWSFTIAGGGPVVIVRAFDIVATRTNGDFAGTQIFLRQVDDAGTNIQWYGNHPGTPGGPHLPNDGGITPI